MDTLKAVISKANSIRWAHRDDLMRSMDNQLSCEETWSNKPSIYFDQIFFLNDSVLIQVKAGSTATVVLTQYFDDGSTTIHTVDDTTARPTVAAPGADTWIIYDYLIIFSALGRSYFKLTTEESTWQSEYVNIIASDTDYRLLQWTNLDEDTDPFEFDYNTTYALANVNYMRILIEDLEYQSVGETDVYDNQNEKSILKSNQFAQILFKSGLIPRQIAQVISIAMAHDSFLVNEVAYVVEKIPEISTAGAWSIVSAPMVQNLNLGMNAHDLGFNCDTVAMSKVININKIAIAALDSALVNLGYSINQIIIELSTGTSGTIKIGTTIGGDDILKTYTLTTAKDFQIFTRNFMPDTGISAAWPIFFTVIGAFITARVQTIKVIP